MTKWTLNNIPDLTGKVMIVTGANSGIGYYSALEFARKGAQTILASRNEEKAEAALAQIKKEVPEAKVEIILLDLADLNSVRQFAEAFLAKYDRLDVLLNNAGIMMVPYGQTADGFERQMGTNHLGHFALTGLLIDVIKKTDCARIINVSSNAHRSGDMNFNNLLYENGAGYSEMRAYGRSKLANLLFTYELQRRLKDAGLDTTALSAHPGLAKTNLANHFAERWYFRLLMPIFDLMLQSSAAGALPQIRASVDPETQGGQYYGPDGFQQIKGDPIVVEPSAAANNAQVAAQLWQHSEQLTGVSFLSAS
jgi:NAD(P)-dependent dehydrogenase (short-subunit alcohol dehydrogenase family)